MTLYQDQVVLINVVFLAFEYNIHMRLYLLVLLTLDRLLKIASNSVSEILLVVINFSFPPYQFLLRSMFVGQIRTLSCISPGSLVFVPYILYGYEALLNVNR